MTPKQYEAFILRVEDNPHPCKYGHFDCSDRERGPCSDEEYPEEYRTEDERIMNPDYKVQP